MTPEGSRVLESLFDASTTMATNDSTNGQDLSWMEDDVIVHGCIYILQSLCIMGMLVGVKGTPEQEQRRVQHLKQAEPDNTQLFQNDPATATSGTTATTATNPFKDRATIAQLKYKSDQTAGTQLLAQLAWKRTNQGAMDLLIALGAWTKHEDLALLRSGFPVSFTQHELQAAEFVAATAISQTTNVDDKDNDDDTTTSTTPTMSTSMNLDVDEILNIRRDLTHHKVYTIDSESTSEVDDGISIEELDDKGRYKFWIHIADADRWAPRHSTVFEIAKARTTTHYLPTGPVPMFPPR
jgi:exoribonuclease-2